MNNIIKTLNTISDRIKNYGYINSGGCCLYAYLIARQLEERKIPYKVLIEYPEYSRTAYYKQAHNEIEHLDIQHVFLKIKDDFYYDYRGVAQRWNTPKIDLNINSRELLNMYNNGIWNSRFKECTSKTGIKKIKKVIKEEFKKYDERVKNSM